MFSYKVDVDIKILFGDMISGCVKLIIESIFLMDWKWKIAFQRVVDDKMLKTKQKSNEWIKKNYEKLCYHHR